MIEYAGFWRRFGATLADGLWMGLLLTPLLNLIYGDVAITDWYNWQIFLLKDVLPALIVILFWLEYQATPGKLLFDCDIVDICTGQPISLKQAVLRYLGYFVAILPIGLGFLWIIWDKRKQGWHDKMAGTVVIMHDEARIPLQQLENIYH